MHPWRIRFADLHTCPHLRMIGEGRGMGWKLSHHITFEIDSFNKTHGIIWKKYERSTQPQKKIASMYQVWMLRRTWSKLCTWSKLHFVNHTTKFSNWMHWCSQCEGQRAHQTHKKNMKNDLQKVILLSDVFAWLSNTIANKSVRQTQKHFTNFMCSSFVFWLAEETKCSSASQGSYFSAPSCNPAWYQHNCAYQNLRGVKFSYFTKLQILEIMCSCLGNMDYSIYTWELWLQQDPPHKKCEKIKSKSQDTFAGPKVERAMMWIHLEPLRV